MRGVAVVSAWQESLGEETSPRSPRVGRRACLSRPQKFGDAVGRWLSSPGRWVEMLTVGSADFGDGGHL